MSEPRLLLIVGFPVGMGALLRQVAVGGFIAEHTGRQAVVLWRDQCLYWPGHDGCGCSNAFPFFFKPVGESLLGRLGSAASWYPASWSASHLAQTRLHNYVFERQPGLNALPEDLSALQKIDSDVMVMDHYMGLEKLLPNVHRFSPDATDGYAAVLHRYAARLLCPAGEWIAEAEEFFATSITGRTLGVHFRGSDKGGEAPVPSLPDVVRTASAILEKEGLDCVFLATDSSPAVDAFRSRFGERLRLAPATRTNSSRGVHLTPGSHYRKGMEVLIDMWLLSRCERLLLTRSSNVAAAVEFLLADPRELSARITEPALSPLQVARHRLRRSLLASRASLRTLIRRK